MTPVFVSHAAADKATTATICDALHLEGVPTWVSFRDINPGANWETSIESALSSAKSVIVIVSPKSVGSSYVRAEVEEAIRRQMTVIPVIVQPVTELPLRWRMLQHVNWNASKTRGTIRKTVSGLPKVAAADFLEALDDSSRFDDVRRLILRHTEWLPMEYRMSPKYAFRGNVNISHGARVDCFAGRLDTVGPRAYLYYLGSPYRKSVNSLGKPSPELRKLLTKIKNHVSILGSDLRKDHMLAPLKLFRSELSGWTSMIGHYAFLKIHLIAGSRHHYQNAE